MSDQKTITTKILIEKDFLEHLLSCLANQKFINESAPCGDAIAMSNREYKNIQQENQRIIDQAYKDGWDFLAAEKVTYV